jgi:uncharacterized protein YcbK (DUF882 family)
MPREVFEKEKLTQKMSSKLGRMFVHWRECEHKKVDLKLFDDGDIKQAIRSCACTIFFKLVE